MKTIPIKVEGLSVFPEGSNNNFATGDITLPNLTPLTSTVSGASILGEVDLPSQGHYGSLEVGIAWRTINKEAFDMVSPDFKGLEIRGAFSEFDNSRSSVVTRAIKVVVRGFSKSLDLGTLAQNATTGTTNTIEATYLKIFIDGQAVFELDKFNYICRINGKDALLDVRKALGLA
ncbi:phage major tail tube protein [Paenibacillus algicola]|uniref:Phage major tail tube protein n=1 Tax=Paenibacillus algicola TaxID=2565926 RepID=A0A4P8XNF9_9BACL|nr:phage major tail tube protein [Paenibacillus algicola]QCT03815.1 phage major tail tube protein [Paenibacillus algicola]